MNYSFGCDVVFKKVVCQMSNRKISRIKWRVLAALAGGVLVTCGGMLGSVQAHEYGQAAQHYNDSSWYAQGVNTTYTEANLPKSESDNDSKYGAVGGWGYFADNTGVYQQISGSNNDAINDATVITQQSIQAALNKESQSANMVIKGGYPYVVVGGNQLMNVNNHTDLTTTINSASTTINGGEYSQMTVVGGQYIVADDKTTATLTGHTNDIHLTLENANFTQSPIIGGSAAQRTGKYTTAGVVQVIDNKVNVTVNSGSYTAGINAFDEDTDILDASPLLQDMGIYAGGMAQGGSTTSTVKEATITIAGNWHETGDIEPRVYGGGIAVTGGHTVVDSAVINVRGGTGLGIQAAGVAVAGPMVFPLNETTLGTDGNFSNIADQDNSFTLSEVNKATVNVYDGDISSVNLSYGSAYPFPSTYESATGAIPFTITDNENVIYPISDADVHMSAIAIVRNAEMNYYGGTISDIVTGDSTNTTTITLHKDLTANDIVALGTDEQYASFMNWKNLGDYIQDPIVTINGGGNNLTSALHVNSLEGMADARIYGAEEESIADKGNITVTVNNVKTLKGDTFVGHDSTVTLNDVKDIEGAIHATESSAHVNVNGFTALNGALTGDGVITLAGDATFTDKTKFNNKNTSLINGQYTGVLSIGDGVQVAVKDGATVTIDDAVKQLNGTGTLVLDTNGTLATTTAQLLGQNADPTNKDSSKNVTALNSALDDKVMFKDGIVVITAPTYSLNFAKNALQVLQAADNGVTKLTIKGALDDTITFDDLKNGLPNQLTLSEATVDGTTATSKNLIITGTNNSADSSLKALKKAVEQANSVTNDATVLTNGFSAGALNLKEDSVGVVITGQQTLQLGGATGGDIITVNGKTPTEMMVVVGDGTSDKNGGGAFIIGNNAATEETMHTLSGAVIVHQNSSLTTNGHVTIAKGITLAGGTVDVQSGQLDSSVDATGYEKSRITGKAIIPALKLAKDKAVLQIGSDDATANIMIKDAILNGGTLLLDPSWDKAAAEISVNFVKPVDGKLLVGQNTYATMGDTNTAKAVFARSGLTFDKDNITAALYIKGNQTLGKNGAVYVDGRKNDEALVQVMPKVEDGSFTVGTNSVTMVDGSATTAKAALSGVTKVSINKKAKLYIDNAEGGKTYHILSNDGTTTIEGIDTSHWTDANLLTNKQLVELTGVYAGNTLYDVVATSKKAEDVYGDDTDMSNIIDKVTTNSPLRQFLQSATDDKINTSYDAQLNAINSVASLSGLAGITQGAYETSSLLADAVMNHLSKEHPLTHDKDVWAKLLHKKTTVTDMAINNVDANYDATYKGAVIGADLYHADNKTLGVAFTYIDGTVDGHSLVTATSTDSNYYGLGVYGRADYGDYALIGDISYTHGSHDITQYNSRTKITGSTNTNVFTVGIRGEKVFNYGEDSQVIPYVGARYLHVATGDYTNSLGLNYSQDGQNIFLLPIGVKFTTDRYVGSWKVRPIVELGYIWNLSGRSVDQTVSYDGATFGYAYDVMDSGSFIGRLGMEAQKGDVTYGVQYEYQKSSHKKANRFDVGVNLKF